MLFLQTQYQNAAPVIKWLFFIITLCILTALVLVVFQIKPNSLSFIKGFISHPGSDSWMPMIEALELIKNAPNLPLYDTLFENGIKFQYPLSSLLLFDLPKRAGISYVQMTFILNCISAIGIAVFSIVSTKILLTVLKEKIFEGLGPASNFEIRLIYFLVFIMTFLYYPILRSFGLGQIQTILSVLIAIAILCWQYDKKILVGVLFGVICLVKPQLGLLFVWAAIRKQWKVVFAGMLIMGMFLSLSILLYGFDNHLYYIKILSFLSHRGEAFHANQSVNGLLNRLFFNGTNVVWNGTFPDYSPVIYYITLITSLILMFGGLLWKYKNNSPTIIELCIIITCTTMASPIAWEHHYTILFTIFLVMSPYIYKFYSHKKGNIMMFSIAYIFVSQYFDFTKLFADTKLNIVQSYLFFGACIMLYFLFNISMKMKTDNKVEVNDSKSIPSR